MAARRNGGRALLQILPRGGGLGLPPSSLPGCLQLVSWLSSSASASSTGGPLADEQLAPPPPQAPPPVLDSAEVAKALRCQQFYEDEMPTLRALKSSIPHEQLLDFMRQRWGGGYCRERVHAGAGCCTPSEILSVLPPISSQPKTRRTPVAATAP